jgi:lipoate-protein ligase B
MELMKALQSKRINDEIHDTLLILEHPEIVTVGPRARNDGIAPPEGYASQAVDRGGGLTWHGPGQIVAYPIFKWDFNDEKSVALIIEKIEAWVIRALEKIGIHGTRDQRMQGVWVKRRKICSIGLSFLRWTSRHGFTINLNTPEGRVEGIAGCGLEQATTTSLSVLGYNVSNEAMVSSLLTTMEESLQRSPVDNAL